MCIWCSEAVGMCRRTQANVYTNGFVADFYGDAVHLGCVAGGLLYSWMSIFGGIGVAAKCRGCIDSGYGASSCMCCAGLRNVCYGVAGIWFE